MMKRTEDGRRMMEVISKMSADFSNDCEIRQARFNHGTVGRRGALVGGLKATKVN